MNYSGSGNVVSIKYFEHEHSGCPELMFADGDWQLIKSEVARCGSHALRRMFYQLERIDDHLIEFPGGAVYFAFHPLAWTLGGRLGIHGRLTQPEARSTLRSRVIELWVREFDKHSQFAAASESATALLWLFACDPEMTVDSHLIQADSGLPPDALYQRFLALPDDQKRGRGYRWEAVRRLGQTLVVRLAGPQFGEVFRSPLAVGPIISAGTSRVASAAVVAPSRRSQVKHLLPMLNDLKRQYAEDFPMAA